MSDKVKVRAYDGALAWLNASIATGRDKLRTAIYRTIRIEFFRTGVQFVAVDGTMLLRTWAPFEGIGDIPAPAPLPEEAPDDAVTVMDVERFALGFMKTLLTATTPEDARYHDLTMVVEPAGTEPPLGKEVQEYVLTLEALGQRLSCKLLDGPFPEWRALKLGLDDPKLVDGMTLSPRMLKAVGSLKGVVGVDCTFRERDRAIEIVGTGGVPVHGYLMPMTKPRDRKKPKAEDDGRQVEHGG